MGTLEGGWGASTFSVRDGNLWGYGIMENDAGGKGMAASGCCPDPAACILVPVCPCNGPYHRSLRSSSNARILRFHGPHSSRRPLYDENQIRRVVFLSQRTDRQSFVQNNACRSPKPGKYNKNGTVRQENGLFSA